MAQIKKRISVKGEESFQVVIRKKGFTISKTFFDEETAKIYEFYKERLIDNMNNFEIPIHHRITVRQIFELKMESEKEHNNRLVYEIEGCLDKIKEFINVDDFVVNQDYQIWLDCAIKLMDKDVYRGFAKEKNKRKMSVSTLRKIFANSSSCFSYAIKQGIEIENFPLKVMQMHVNKMKGN